MTNASKQFHPLRICETRPQTAKATALRFDIPDELKETFKFVPGQYLTLRAQIDGKEVRRSYSISSAEQEEYIEVGIKQVEGGIFSNFAASLSKGDTLEVMPPMGRFTAPIGGRHNYLIIAAGSGITPCLSIAQSVLRAEPRSTITLVYGNSRISTIMFREEIDALKDIYTNRFNLIHVLSQERQDIDFLHGRIDKDMLQALTSRHLILPQASDAAFLCGPQSMTQEAVLALEQLGMEKEAIKTELFAAPSQPNHAPPRRKLAAHQGVPVLITADGTQNAITVDGENETILKAAQRQGIDLPFSCAGGMCCTCRCKIIAGEADMDVNYSLQDWEVEQGFILACQARPTSENLELDFDSV